MTLTPETLTKHELIGLDVRVAAASNPDLLDANGTVVFETMQTLTIEDATRARQVPKRGTTFEFVLPGDDDTDVVVTVEGAQLVERPARRTERTGDSKWR
jgi:ribonuclease P protein subunit POP4